MSDSRTTCLQSSCCYISKGHISFLVTLALTCSFTSHKRRKVRGYDGCSLKTKLFAFASVSLSRLIKASLIEKADSKYRIADPILAYGILREPFNE